MTETLASSWVGLVVLGAFHGLNPGTGWLFAVALGMQERRRSAVYRAMVPLALGHGLAIAAAVSVALAGGAVVPLRAVQWTVAAVLVAFGLARIFRHRHPRWVGMQVGLRDLTVWSFLMASAHGAGLMVVPLVLASGMAPHCDLHVAPGAAAAWGTAIHSTAYLAVSLAIAAVVFEKVGLAFLRSAWFNLDVVWAATLVLTGVITAVRS